MPLKKKKSNNLKRENYGSATITFKKIEDSINSELSYQDREDILITFADINHTTIAIKAGRGIITANTPNPVATPLPPSKRK